MVSVTKLVTLRKMTTKSKVILCEKDPSSNTEMPDFEKGDAPYNIVITATEERKLVRKIDLQ